MTKASRVASARFSNGYVHSKQLTKTNVSTNHKYCYALVLPSGKKIIRFTPSPELAAVKIRVIASDYLDLPNLHGKRPAAAWERAKLHAFKQNYSLDSDEDIKNKRKELISELLNSCDYEIVEATVS